MKPFKPFTFINQTAPYFKRRPTKAAAESHLIALRVSSFSRSFSVTRGRRVRFQALQDSTYNCTD
ncbi:hypothetical protein QQ045_028998 [Rhodiola kirilowii]